MTSTTYAHSSVKGATITKTTDSRGRVSYKVTQAPSFKGVETDSSGRVTRRYYGSSPTNADINRINALAERVEKRDTAAAQQKQAAAEQQMQLAAQRQAEQQKIEAARATVTQAPNKQTGTLFMSESVTKPEASPYTPTKLEAGVGVTYKSPYRMSDKAASAEGRDNAMTLASGLAQATGKQYKVVMGDEQLGDEWVVERVIGGQKTATSTKTEQTGTETYIITKDQMTIKEGGKVKNTLTPEGASTTTKVVVTSGQYSIYEDGQLVEKRVADDGAQYDKAQAQKILTEAGYNVTTENGKVVATQVAKPQFDLDAAAQNATMQGYNVRREGDKVVVDAPIMATTTTYTSTPTGGREPEVFLIAREATPTEKWVQKAGRQSAETREAITNAPLIGELFQRADFVRSKTFTAIDNAAAKIPFVGSLAGKATQGTVSAVLSPVTIIPDMAAASSKVGTFGELMVTKGDNVAVSAAVGREIPSPLKMYMGKDTAVQRYIAENPMAIPETLAFLAGSAIVTYGVSKIATQEAVKHGLIRTQTTTQAQADIVAKEGNVAYSEIYAKGKTPTLFGEVRSYAQGTGSTQSLPSGFKGEAAYTISGTKTGIFGTDKLTPYAASQRSVAMGARVTDAPTQYGMQGNIPYGITNRVIDMPVDDASVYFGYSKTSTSLGTTNLARTASREFLGIGDDAAVYQTVAKGYTESAVGGQTAYTPFTQTGVLTVRDLTTSASGGAGGGGTIANIAGGGSAAVGGGSAAGVDATLASMAQGIKTEVALQSAQQASIVIPQEAAQAATMPTLAANIAQGATKQRTSYKESVGIQKTQAQVITVPQQVQLQTQKTKQPQILLPMSVQDQLTITGTKKGRVGGQVLLPAQASMADTSLATSTVTVTEQVLLPQQVQLTQTVTPEYPQYAPPVLPFDGSFVIPMFIPPTKGFGGGGGAQPNWFNVFETQPRAYQPSVAARIFDITATKQPAAPFTGVGVRPVITPPKKRRKKR